MRTLPIHPIRIIKALRFGGFLRQTQDFDAALEAANEYQADDDDDQASCSAAVKNPCKTTRLCGEARLDVLSCLLHRRIFSAMRLFDMIFCINIFTDASPVVKEKFQGMMCDIMMLKA